MLFGSFLISKQSAPSIERLDEHGAAAPQLAALLVLPTCRRGVCALGHYCFPSKKPYFTSFLASRCPILLAAAQMRCPRPFLKKAKNIKQHVTVLRYATAAPTPQCHGHCEL